MFFYNFAFGFGISVKFCIFRYPYWPIWRKKFSALFKKNIMQSILIYSMDLSRWGRRRTYMRRDAGEEGGREFSSKMPRTISNLPDFPRRPFLYAHLLYTKSMNRSKEIVLPLKKAYCSDIPHQKLLLRWKIHLKI